MAKKVFAVYLAKEDVPNSEAYATLELPASPWELWDAMEKVRLKDGEALYMEIDDYYAFEYLAPHLEELDISLNELNDLAARLATLDEVQGIAFEGLFSMEVQKKVNTNGGIITMQDSAKQNYERTCHEQIYLFHAGGKGAGAEHRSCVSAARPGRATRALRPGVPYAQ